jgi:hypothetical protein
MYQLLRDMQVTPWWSRTKADAWAMELDKWFTEEYQQAHDAARERRLMMEGPSHHQGQRSLPSTRSYGYAVSLIDFEAQTCFITLMFVLLFLQEKAHHGQECSDFDALCMAHKGKATSDVSYSVSDGPEAYNNPTFGRRIAEYTEACKQKYGEDYNPSEHDIDTDIVLDLGGGKKHGRLWIGDDIIDSSSLRRADVRAQRTESDP